MGWKVEGINGKGRGGEDSRITDTINRQSQITRRGVQAARTGKLSAETKTKRKFIRDAEEKGEEKYQERKEEENEREK